MLVSLDDMNREDAIAAMRALEVELFGRHAWSENMVRQELDAPARTYVFDVTRDDGGQADAVAHADARTDARTDVEDADGTDDARTAAGASRSRITVRGFAGYWYDGDDAEIMDVGVGRAFQRRGIAAAMMTWLIDRARNQGARRMLLEVAVNNDPALALYTRFGFTRIGLRRRYYQPEGIDAYVMALDLQPRVVGFAAVNGATDETSATGTAADSPMGTQRTEQRKEETR